MKSAGKLNKHPAAHDFVQTLQEKVASHATKVLRNNHSKIYDSYINRIPQQYRSFGDAYCTAVHNNDLTKGPHYDNQDDYDGLCAGVPFGSYMGGGIGFTGYCKTKEGTRLLFHPIDIILEPGNIFLFNGCQLTTTLISASMVGGKP
jgi:hypothetical protein